MRDGPPRDAEAGEQMNLALGRRVKGCPPPDVLLPALAGDVLSSRFSAAVRQHLQHCPFCSELTTQIEDGVHALAQKDLVRVHACVAAALPPRASDA